MPRYEVEARRERMVRVGIAVLAGLIVVILAGAALYQYVLLPRQTLASVGGAAIAREEYWQVRAVDLWNQGSQFRQFAGMVDANLAPQYQQMAADAINQIPGVWGSGEVDSATLSRMIDDQVYLQSLDEMGLSIADDEVGTYLLNQFADPSAPLLTPTPTPTFTPNRAAMATETALALAATPAATPAMPAATPVTGLGPATPGASPVASPPAATPVATPSPDQARAIAESNFGLFSQALFDEAHLTRESYTSLVARPALARERIDARLAAEVGQGAAQVHAAHILVDTEDLARELADQLANGADFSQLASQHSIDEGTAPNGGDLGWFTRDEMVAPFAAAAFELEPGQISAPVQSEFGWHIIRSLEREAERALSDQQITRLAQTRAAAWLEARRAELAISSSLAPSPTPGPAAFEAPVEAPPPPTPTPLPAASPVATPIAAAASPVAAGASPVATP